MALTMDHSADSIRPVGLTKPTRSRATLLRSRASCRSSQVSRKVRGMSSRMAP